MTLSISDMEKTYDLCVSTGRIKEKYPDTELIKSLVLVAEKGLQFIDSKSKDIPKDSTDWTFVFRDYYESLRGLIEANLLFEGIEAESHQCKNAYICIKHPELELDWNFLESARLKRNDINYRGHLMTYADWNSFRMNFSLHLNALRKFIKEKFKS